MVQYGQPKIQFQGVQLGQGDNSMKEPWKSWNLPVTWGSFRIGRTKLWWFPGCMILRFLRIPSDPNWLSYVEDPFV